MNTNMKVLLTGIVGMSLMVTPILSNAANSNNIQAVSSATTKQSSTPVSLKTATAPPSSKTTTTTPVKKEVWTIEKVKVYNGKSGNLAYIVVNGVIYDVTNVPNWKNGSHNGLNAGADLTVAFSKSPHSSKLLQQLKVIAKIGDPILSSATNAKPLSNGSQSAAKSVVPASKSLKESSLKEHSNKTTHDFDEDSDDNKSDDHDEENEHNDDH